jgi:hypothetical protein
VGLSSGSGQKNLTLKHDESVKSQNQTVLKKVQIQGAQILQS